MTNRKRQSGPVLRQRGSVLVLGMLLLVVGGSALLFSYYTPPTMALENDQKTTDALAQVKAALVGWTVKRGSGCTVNSGGWTTCTGNDRPGEFPCPDLTNDGNAATTCSAGQLGRVPWKTLGIPEPKDAAGETLWYAVAGPFRTRAAGNTAVVNSDTRGTITVYATDGTTVLTSQAAVVLLAPGQAFGTQSRTAANKNSATHHLDTGPNNRNNATANGPFIMGRPSPTFNDRVAYLTTTEFMPSVEMRVGAEAKNWLDGYRNNSTCQCYPWAANFFINTGAAAAPSYPNASATGVNRGRFPFSNAGPENWTAPRPVLSSWFTYNNWHLVIFYTLARQNAQNQGVSPTDCTTCTQTTLTIDGKAVISSIILTPGTPLGTITRPSNSVTDYIEDPANRDGTDDIYVTPTATHPDRDRLYTSVSPAAAASPAQQCPAMGQALRKLAPCGQPPKMNSQCAALAGTDLNGNRPAPPAAPSGLAVCSSACSSASLTLVNTPCQNTLKPSQCSSAHKTLNSC